MAVSLQDRMISILDKYSGDHKLGSGLKSIVEKASAPEMIVPVIGMQGMGKSTLINALLKENILPNEADETTCVPVEVRYGTTLQAEVFFSNSSSTVVVKTQDELAQYVDNQYNPANEKKVSRIVLYRNLELLRTGLVIVDLPGVGSLTPENQKTTERYIESLATAIFVIPTSPTIRKQESYFIKSVWAQFADVTFVQNDWDEGAEEVRQSVEYNSGILKNVADQINRKFDGNIIVVNAYNALVGALQKDSSLQNASNIAALESRLKNVAANWKDNMSRSVEETFRRYVKCVRDVIQKELQKLDMSAKDLQEQQKREYMDYLDESNQFKKVVVDVLKYLEQMRLQVQDFLKNEAGKCTKTIRSRVYKVIDGGVTDGELLNDALRTAQNEEIAEFHNIVLDKFLKIKNDLEDKLDELKNAISDEMSFSNISVEGVNRPEALKFEKGLQIGFSIAGGIGAALIMGTGGLAIVAAVGIAAVGSLIGWLTKKGVRSSRASNAKKDVDPIIDSIAEKIVKTPLDQYDLVGGKVKVILKSMQALQQKELLSRYARASQTVAPSGEANVLKSDLSYLNQMGT